MEFFQCDLEDMKLVHFFMMCDKKYLYENKVVFILGQILGFQN